MPFSIYYPFSCPILWKHSDLQELVKLARIVNGASSKHGQ